MASLSQSKTLRFQAVNMSKPEQAQQIEFLTSWLRECPDDEFVFCANKAGDEWIQEAFSVKDLRKAIELRNVSIAKPNSFISANTFSSDRYRNYASLASLTTFFVDLDYQKTSRYASVSDKDAAQLLLQHMEKEQLPLPSYLVSTGHGLHAWWFIVPQPAGRIRVWKEIQNELVKSLKAFGADDAAKDGARMLRVPYTDNLKDANAAVRTSIVWKKSNTRLTKFESMYHWMRRSIKKRWLLDVRRAFPAGSACADLPLFQIDYLLQEGKIAAPAGVDPMPESTPVDFMEERTLPAYPAPRKTRAMRDEEKNENTLRHVAAACSVPVNRIRDLETLIQLREGSVEGYRDKILFLLNCFMQHAHFEAQKRMSELQRFNGMFEIPLPQSEVNGIWHNGRLAYTPSNAYIIRILDMTEAEQTAMKTVISAQEKVRRRREQNKCGMSRTEHREFILSEILEGITNGESVAKIASRHHVTRQTVYYWVKRYSLKTSGVVRCAQIAAQLKENTKHEKDMAKAAKKAAAEMLDKIHRKSISRSSREKKTQSQKNKFRLLKKQAIKIFLQLIEKSQDEKLLECLQKAFFEMTGKSLKHIRQFVKISSTPAFESLFELIYRRYFGPEFGKEYGKHAFSLLNP